VLLLVMLQMRNVLQRMVDARAAEQQQEQQR
jgi:hypothetical protein